MSVDMFHACFLLGSICWATAKLFFLKPSYHPHVQHSCFGFLCRFLRFVVGGWTRGVPVGMAGGKTPTMRILLQGFGFAVSRFGA